MAYSVNEQSALSEVLQLAEELLSCMETRDFVRVQNVFAPDKVEILDSFYPYVFQGEDAVESWANGFIRHAKNLGDLRHSFGLPQEHSSRDGLAFVSLPVTWQGTIDNKLFHETGGLALVLVNVSNQWKIQNYAWAATSYTLKDDNL